MKLLLEILTAPTKAWSNISSWAVKSLIHTTLGTAALGKGRSVYVMPELSKDGNVAGKGENIGLSIYRYRFN